MRAKRFQDLVAWQLGRELRRSLGRLLRKPAVAGNRDFLVQTQRACRTVTANIGEGCPCTHAEFARFLDISARSLREIEDRLVEAVDENLVTPDEAAESANLVKRTFVAVSRLAAYLRSTPDPPRFPPRRRRRR